MGIKFEDPPRFSFVIPSYRSRRTIAFTLQALKEMEGDERAELLVVDSSPRAVGDWFRTHYPFVRILQVDERLFPGAARNLGAQQARGEFLAFLDADTVPDPRWLVTLTEVLNRSPEAAIVGGHVRNANPQHLPSKIQYWIEFSDFLPGSVGGVRPFLSSSNLLMRRRLFLEGEGFPEEMAMAEDMVFFHRIDANACYEPTAGIGHLHRTRWGDVFGHLKALGQWSGRARHLATDLSGSRLVRTPLAAYPAGLWRLGQILRRLLAAGETNEFFTACLLAPFLGAGLFSWARGFHRGLREKPGEWDV